MIEATLPLPPSANNLFVNLKSGGRAKSASYKSWLNKAATILGDAFLDGGAIVVPHDTKMRLTARVGANYRRDVSNCIKPVEDALCAFLPVPDDRYNDHVTIERDLSIEGFVYVRLEPLA